MKFKQILLPPLLMHIGAPELEHQLKGKKIPQNGIYQV